MELKELNLPKEVVEEIATKIKLSIEDTLESEVHTETNFVSMAKWIREYDEDAFSLIDELDSAYIIDPKRNLLENFLLQTGQVYEMDKYILFVYR